MVQPFNFKVEDNKKDELSWRPQNHGTFPIDFTLQ